MNRPRVFALLALCAAALSGCDPRVVTYRVQVISVSCADPQPLDGAQLLKLSITGDGISEPIEATAALSARSAQIPSIPAGRNRVVEVRAYSGEVTAAGRVVAVGRSAPFEVPEVLPVDREVVVPVVLRRANAFGQPSAASAPMDCQSMRVARAGHTATLLPDGKVFIAGGYQISPVLGSDGGTVLQRTTLNSTEIFDPETGLFSEGQPMGVKNTDNNFSPLPRAFHTATLLSTGQVLLAGGEVTSENASFATRSALVFDYPPRASGPAYGGFQLQAGRMRHAAAHDSDAGVLLIGGVGTDGGLVDTLEWYESQRGVIRAVPGTLKRSGMAVSPVQNGKLIAVAGGTDGEYVKDDVLFFSFDAAQGTFVQEAAKARLRHPRRAAGIAGFGDSKRILLVGGYSSLGDPVDFVLGINTSEIVKSDDAQVVEGPNVASPRGDICAAQLRDGRVLAIGGRTGEYGLPRSAETVELISPEADGKATALGLERINPGRYWHTCTTLNDGSVLVLGGVSEGLFGNAPEVLQDAWIFTPSPLANSSRASSTR